MPEQKERASKVGGSFEPSKLSKEQQEAVVEEYLGVHPKYFLYRGLNIQLNHGRFSHEGNAFNGWKPNRRKYTG